MGAHLRRQQKYIKFPKFVYGIRILGIQGTQEYTILFLIILFVFLITYLVFYQRKTLKMNCS